MLEQLRLSGGLVELGSAGERRRFQARFCRAGQIRAAGNRPGKVVVTRAALRDNVAAFDGRAVFIDHPARLDAPSLRNLVGVTSDAVYNVVSDGVDGVITFYANEDGDAMVALLEQLLLDQAAGRPAPDVGLSLNFWPIWEDGPDGLARVVGVQHVESIDLVFEPAADGRVLTALGAHDHEGVVAMDEVKVGPVSTGGAPGETAVSLDGWNQAAVASAAASIIDKCGLPGASRARLAAGSYGTPDELAAAIEAERSYLAALEADRVVQIGGTAPRGGSVQMRDPRDEAQGIVDWLFGVRGAGLPEPDMRRPSRFYRALTGDVDWHNRVAPERAMFGNASTTALADLAADAVNKILVEQWESLEAYRWYEPLVAVQPNDGSVKSMKWVTFGGVSNLPTVTQGGAYTELTVADAKETDSFAKKGAYVGITIEMWRNDDLQSMQAIPRELANAAIRTRSYDFSYIFTQASGTGPTLDDDSTVLFHSNHGSNVQTTAFSAAAWKAARLECFKHTALGSGKRLGLHPKYCLIPIDLLDEALVAFGYGQGAGGYPGTGNNDVNPYGVGRGNSDPRPIPVVVPDWTDTSDWAYLVDPALHPVLMISYAQNPGGRVHAMPEIFTMPVNMMPFFNDMMPVLVRDWYAFGVATWRGVGKRNVT